MIYLDNAATTGVKPNCVIEAVESSMRNLSVNAGRGSYKYAQKASELMDECRARLLSLAHLTSGYHVYYSPSATIAMNQLILGINCDSYTTFIVSPFEHNAAMRPIEYVCKRTGAKWCQLPFNHDTWQLQLDEVEDLFTKCRPSYVFVSAVSNTTGYVLPLKQIVEKAHAHEARVIVDCAQALGSVTLDYADIGADAYVFAGHKTLYGPLGIAGIILSDSWRPSYGLFGGTGTDSLNLSMPEPDAGGFEPGSPNTPAIAGLNAALQWIDQIGVDSIETHEMDLISQFIAEASGLSKVFLYVPPKLYRSSMVAVNVDGYKSRDVGEILDEEFGICVRSGYQCAPLVHDWIGSIPYSGVVRVSVSYFNTAEDIEKVIDALKTL